MTCQWSICYMSVWTHTDLRSSLGSTCLLPSGGEVKTGGSLNLLPSLENREDGIVEEWYLSFSSGPSHTCTHVQDSQLHVISILTQHEYTQAYTSTYNPYLFRMVKPLWTVFSFSEPGMSTIGTAKSESNFPHSSTSYWCKTCFEVCIREAST